MKRSELVQGATVAHVTSSYGYEKVQEAVVVFAEPWCRRSSYSWTTDYRPASYSRDGKNGVAVAVREYGEQWTPKVVPLSQLRPSFDTERTRKLAADHAERERKRLRNLSKRSEKLGTGYITTFPEKGCARVGIDVLEALMVLAEQGAALQQGEAS